MRNLNNVIIVGAGASAEFGLPTGESVLREARKQVSLSTQKAVEGFAFQNGFHDYLLNHPNRTAFLLQYPQFQEQIGKSLAVSIDRLSWHNTELSELCKAFSAWHVMKSLYQESTKSTGSENDNALVACRTKIGRHLSPTLFGIDQPKDYDSSENYQNWIARITHDWLGDALTPDDLSENKLTFVTFNYDLILEEAIQQFIEGSSIFCDMPQSQHPEIIHIHGAFPDQPENLTYKHLDDACESISYIDEGGIVNNVELAKQRLMDARKITVVGFNFDQHNVDLLSLKSFAGKMNVLNYDGNRALRERLSSLNVPAENVLSGKQTATIGVSAAASQGFFDCLWNNESFMDWL